MKKRKKASATSPRRARSEHIAAAGKPARPARAKPAKRTASIAKAKADKPTAAGKAAAAGKASAAKNPTAAPTASSAVSLPAECTVSGAASLKEQLATVLEEPLAVTLNVSSLQRIDTAALQVLTAFVRERTDHDRTVEWHGSAPVLATAAQLLGLTSALKLPS